MIEAGRFAFTAFLIAAALGGALCAPHTYASGPHADQPGESAAGAATGAGSAAATERDAERFPSVASGGLAARLERLDGIAATFRQTVADADGALLEDATGSLHVSKPRLKWEIGGLFPQTVLVDEAAVRIYDPDLEQVTERPLDAGWTDVPLALLTRDALDIEAAFDVRMVELAGAGDLYILRPRDPDTLFERLELRFAGEGLAELVVVDHIGQTTRVEFDRFATDQVLQSSLFELALPPGTDIVRG